MVNAKIVFTDEQWQNIERMASIFCTGEEIANILGINYETLDRRIKERYNCLTVDFLKKHQSSGKMSLRRQQYKSALEDKNITMLIWLGKQHLGQTDKQEVLGKGGTELKFEIIVPKKGLFKND